MGFLLPISIAKIWIICLIHRGKKRKGWLNTLFVVGRHPFSVTSSCDLIECLFEVGNDVVDVFHADGEAHCGWSDVLRCQFLGGEL